MGRRAAVDMLPPDLRDELTAKLVENGFSAYEALAEWIASKGYSISKSALHRFGSDLESQFEEAMQDARRSVELARAMRASGNADGDGVLLDAASTVLQDQLLRISMALRTVEVDPQEAVKLVSQASRALADLGRLKVSYEKWQTEARERAQSASEAITEKARKGGLSDDVIRQIEEQVLGIVR